MEPTQHCDKADQSPKKPIFQYLINSEVKPPLFPPQLTSLSVLWCSVSRQASSSFASGESACSERRRIFNYNSSCFSYFINIYILWAQTVMKPSFMSDFARSTGIFIKHSWLKWLFLPTHDDHINDKTLEPRGSYVTVISCAAKVQTSTNLLSNCLIPPIQYHQLSKFGVNSDDLVNL